MPDSVTIPADAYVPAQVNLCCGAGAVTIEATTGTDAPGTAADADAAGAGTLPRFSMVGYTGDAMKVEGWRHRVVLDLAGLTIPSQTRPVRFAHSPASGVGHTDRITVEGSRLIASGVVSRDTDVAREIVVSGKRGFPWQASIGASVDQAELIKPGKFVTVNGRSFEGPVYVVHKSTLNEVSLVDLGADQNTSAQITAQQHNLQKEVSVMPTDTPPPTTVTAAAPVTETPNPEPAQDPITALRAQAVAETQRIAAVRRLCAGKHEDLEAKAITEGWTPEKCELEVLRAARPNVPEAANIVTHRRDADLASGQVLEAACMLTAKLAKPDDLYDEQTLDAASKRFRGGIGLQELILEAAWANGYTGRNFRDPRKILQCAFHPDVTASGGFSTVGIGGILSNGPIVEVGRGRWSPDAIPHILASRDRAQADPTLPPTGLWLEWIRYD